MRLSPNLLSVASACAALACSTQDLHPDVMTLSAQSSADSSPGGTGSLSFYVIRDDVYSQDATPVYEEHPPYRLMVDGRLAAWEDGSYVTAFANSEAGVPLPAGQYAVALVDVSGAVAATAPAVEIRAGTLAEVAFFGGPGAFRSVSMLDDPAAVPAGSTHVRLLDALDDHQPVELVQCPSDPAADPPASCVPVAAALAYGDLTELDATPDVLAKLGWRWAPPGATGSVINPMHVESTGPVIPFETRIPVHVLGPAGECPSCVYADF